MFEVIRFVIPVTGLFIFLFFYVLGHLCERCFCCFFKLSWRKIVSKVLAKYEGIKKKIDMSKIRVLPDFELLCEVISQCLGNSPDAFLEAWTSTRDEQVNQGLDSSMVAIVLEDYIREQYILQCGKNLNFKDNQINKEKCKISESPLKFFKIQLEHGREMGLFKEEDKRFPQDPKIYGRAE